MSLALLQQAGQGQREGSPGLSSGPWATRWGLQAPSRPHETWEVPAELPRARHLCLKLCFLTQRGAEKEGDISQCPSASF